MRATRGYAAGIGTTGALVGAIGCAFAVLSAVVAVNGWPLPPASPGVATLDRSAGSPIEDSLRQLLQGFAPARATRGTSAARGAIGVRVRRLVAAERGDGVGAHGPFARVLDPSAGDGMRPVAPAARGPLAASASPGPGVAAPSPSPTPAPVPPAPSAPQPPGATQTPGTGPSSGSGTSPGLGGTVVQVSSGTGTAVTQTGQQLGGAVQGATAQLGGAVGQVSPAAGQVVTQTGQLAGGVVSGTAGTAGQVVAGAGTAVGGLVGGLAGRRR